jgi:hypothetical protein
VKSIFQHIARITVIVALFASTIGITTVSLSCPMGKEMTAGCPKCKHTRPERNDGCCKTTVQFTVLKTEFQKPVHFKTTLSHQLIIFALLPEVFYSDIHTRLSSTPIPEHMSCLSTTPVEKCALLSTFLI